jgi:hypothetical protein
MPSKLSSWPTGWPSFTLKDNDANDKYQQDLKREINSVYGEVGLKQAWIKTCKELDSVTSRMAEQGSTAVPAFKFDDVIGPKSANPRTNKKRK